MKSERNKLFGRWICAFYFIFKCLLVFTCSRPFKLRLIYFPIYFDCCDYCIFWPSLRCQKKKKNRIDFLEYKPFFLILYSVVRNLRYERVGFMYVKTFIRSNLYNVRQVFESIFLVGHKLKAALRNVTQHAPSVSILFSLSRTSRTLTWRISIRYRKWKSMPYSWH